MKKIILLVVAIVLIVSISVVGFMGCQGTTALTQIFSEVNIWDGASLPEEYSYSMYEAGNNTSIGILTMKVEQLTTNTTYYMGTTGLVESTEPYLYSFTTPSVNATYKATTTLTLLDGSYTQTSVAIFAKNFKMISTYQRTITTDAEEAYVSYNVDNKKYYYRTNDNWDNELSIKNGKYQSSPYFDNTMIYYIARTMPNDSTYSTFTFNIFDLDKQSKEKVTMTNPTDTTDTFEVNSVTYSTKKITMSTSDTLLGTTNYVECYTNTQKMNNYKNVIIKIVEGNYSYVINA